MMKRPDMNPPLKTGIAALLAATLLAGCTLLPERAAISTFRLPDPQMPTADEATVPMTLRVLTPAATPPLNSTRILVNPRGLEVQAYSGARWSNPPPLLLRDYWIDSFRQNGNLKAVISDASSAGSELSLTSDLMRFQLVYNQGEPAVMVQVDAQVLATDSRRVLAARRFQSRQPVEDQPVEAVIAGFAVASERVTRDMVNWLHSVSRDFYGETDPARPPSGTGSLTRE
ncbi:ABC-type transport auxiliary lipoprotein family protein [Marinobacter halotolerans]|uniref:ABC-type transport auxiliary lipoprotein family protein n=1 Tax=Marinobacter halotolerans TaxID=1569211 RepID=UPI0012488EE6|nr:ABC-type transport auxiliary lipoprotein family protein [Marinobacter halotolerans]